MPVVDVTLPDVSQSVMRPIVFDVIRQVQSITKIDSKAKIFYPGETNKMQQGGTSIDDRNRDAVMSSNQIVFIEVEEDYDLEALSTTAVNYQEQLSVFNDARVSTKITPIYVDSGVTIHFRYRTRSKTEALRWRDDIRIRVSAMRDINLHKFTYHYLLPEQCIQLLSTIHHLRENVAGYGESFEEWVKSNATNRLTLIGDLTNKNARLGISETQMRIVGTYGFDGVPEKPERDDATGTWTISFSYKFTYNRPAACMMSYPVMVHNQLIPPEYVSFNTEVPNDPTKVDKSFSISMNAMNHFEQQSVLGKQMRPGYFIRIPDHDEFTIPEPPPYTGTIFTALCESDLETKLDLLNLNELGDIILDPDILDFIAKSEYPYITKLYNSILQLSLYRGNFLAGNEGLSCDSSLNVRTNHVQDLRIVHHVRFSIVTNPTILTADALQRLRSYPKAFVKIVTCINESLVNNPDLAKYGERNYVTASDFDKYLRLYINAKQNPGMVISRKTLQLGSVISRRTA